MNWSEFKFFCINAQCIYNFQGICKGESDLEPRVVFVVIPENLKSVTDMRLNWKRHFLYWMNIWKQLQNYRAATFTFSDWIKNTKREKLKKSGKKQRLSHTHHRSELNSFVNPFPYPWLWWRWRSGAQWSVFKNLVGKTASFSHQKWVCWDFFSIINVNPKVAYVHEFLPIFWYFRYLHSDFQFLKIDHAQFWDPIFYIYRPYKLPNRSFLIHTISKWNS